MNYKRFLTVAFGAALMLAGTCDEPNPVNNNTPEKKPVYGSIQITLVAPDELSAGYASVLGRVNDGPTPSPIIWEEKASAGGCKLLVPRVPSCPEPCGGGAACVEDDSCQPYPSAIAVGTVTVQGLKTKEGATSFSMDPVGGNYQPTGVLFEYPPFSEGAAVTVTAPGNSTSPAISLTGKGISPLKVSDDSIWLETGKPVTLRWTPPAITGNTVIFVRVDISHHGGTAGVIESECPDNGSLTIPASLVDALKALGYFGFPKIEISRKAVAKDAATNVELVIESKITKYVYIPGLISCNGDEDCPGGQTCENFRCK